MIDPKIHAKHNAGTAHSEPEVCEWSIPDNVISFEITNNNNFHDFWGIRR